ncbi:LOW QUALITY PROTEIN: uncharacterized protein [Malus domestica]|uniref:LOW QUALITY PROTEIN: uncharacterized protein n=1 Tax=Malus domestica TaxID=3750 RepID=UPI00397485E5
MLRGGKSYVSARPAFATDAKRLLVCTGTAVSIFTTSTGLQISSLEGHNASVTSVIVVPGNKALSFCWTASNAHFLYGCSVYNGSTCEGTQENDFQTRKPEAITISPSGKFFGIRYKRKLHIWRVPAIDSKLMISKNITLHHTRNFNVLAFHPTQTIVAADDTSGRILIWTGFGKGIFSDGGKLMKGRSMNNEDERDGVRGDDNAHASSTWHWHGAGISVLSFSSDGAYLYLGGMEGVFVVWQLDTGKKSFCKFLPKIGSPLRYLTDSPDPSLSSISCADNQIHILKMPSMEILKSISGIKRIIESSSTACLMTVKCLRFKSVREIINQEMKSEDARISSLVCHPTRRKVASSSYCGDFKIWVCSDEILQKHEVLQHSGWMCHAVGSYKNKPMTAAAFSGDGSVLAVAAENVITLWDPDNNALVAVIGEMQIVIVSDPNHLWINLSSETYVISSESLY